MKLIREVIDRIDTIVEAKADGSKEHYINGIFIQCNVKNKNRT